MVKEGQDTLKGSVAEQKTAEKKVLEAFLNTQQLRGIMEFGRNPERESREH